MTMYNCKNPFDPKRLLAILAFFLFWCFVITGRLIQFQIIQHEELSDYARQIYSEAQPILVRRGIIYDSRMAELATSLTVSTVLADPELIHDVRGAVETLAPLLEIDPGMLMSRIKDPEYKKPVAVKRSIDPITASHVRELRIDGISLREETLRVYPYQNLASHTLGFVNKAQEGVAGLELKYNELLSGTAGEAMQEVDALGRPFSEKRITLPVPGHSLVLSIDRYIQHLVQKELEAGVRQSGATAGVAIVIEPDNEHQKLLFLLYY